MRNKFIIIYFGDWWDNRCRRRQQLAYRLAHKTEVEKLIYVELPISLVSLVKYFGGFGNPFFRSCWRRILKTGFVRSIGKVRVITPISILPLYRTSKCSYLSELFLVRFTKSLIRRYLSNQDYPCILWLSHPLLANYIGRLGEVHVCYDHTEIFSEYKDWSNKLRKKAGKLDDYISRKADLVFVQTEAQLIEKQRINPNTYLIPNAVDLNLFSKSLTNIPGDIKTIKRPILGFSGSMSYRIDYHLLSKLAAQHPEWSLVLIGQPDDKSVHILGNYQNIHFIGEKPYNVLPQYLRKFDVGLIPYRIDDLTYNNPLKLFDYLASGIPIVSTAIPGVKGFENIIAIAQSHNEFISHIEWSLNNDNSTMLKQRKEAVKLHTWDARTKQVWQLIEERLYKKT